MYLHPVYQGLLCTSNLLLFLHATSTMLWDCVHDTTLDDTASKMDTCQACGHLWSSRLPLRKELQPPAHRTALAGGVQGTFSSKGQRVNVGWVSYKIHQLCSWCEGSCRHPVIERACHIPIKPYLWILTFEFHIIFICHEIRFFVWTLPPPHLKT